MTTGNILVLDVGGSFLKYGVADEKGALLPGSVGEAPARADESPEKVYEAFEEVIRRARETAPLAGACACFPGPFDYTHGVFRMKHKFQALFGCSILPPFERAGLPVRFLHDSTAYILGEHGDSQVPVWSSATVAGEPVDAFYQSQKGRDLDHAGIAERTKNAGGTVIKLKGATFYGVAMSTSRIVEAICEDENSVLPVAHVLGEKFGPLQNVAISLPCVINREGIARVVRPVMNEAETQALTRSAETLRTFMDQALTE